MARLFLGSFAASVLRLVTPKPRGPEVVSWVTCQAHASGEKFDIAKSHREGKEKQLTCLAQKKKKACL